MVDSVGTTHHVKINGEHYLIRPGTYRKRPAPLFGARFTTGDPDFNNLSFWQHWVQQCWVGGFGAEDWMDDAMYDEGSGIDSTQHEVMTLSRDMGPSSNRSLGGNWDLDGVASRRQFTIFNNKLYCLVWGAGAEPGGGEGSTPARLYRFDDATTTWVHFKTFADAVRDMEPFAGYLVFGDGGPNLVRMTKGEVFSTFAKPAGITLIPDALRTYRGRLYVAFNHAIWRLKPDFTWDGSTVFYTAQGTDFIHLADIHLNQLYFMSNNGHLIRTDGNNTFDIWQFDPGITPTGMRSFDGRLFVSVVEPLEGTSASQAVLYQFTGSAVTELKRWGKVGKDLTTGRLRVRGSRLFFGAGNLLGMGEGIGVAVYDPREDAYHLWSTNMAQGTGGIEGRDNNVHDIISYRGYIYASVYGSGIWRTKVSFKDASRFHKVYDTTGQGAPAGANSGGWYSSSDFDAGTPGLLKLWNAMTIHCDLPTTDVKLVVEISSDGGQTWMYAGGSQAAATITKTTAATRYSKTIRLQDNSGLGQGFRATRLKYRITFWTGNTLFSPFLRSVVVRYLPIPEPNWQWEMQLVLSERQELLNHTREAPNVQDLSSANIASKLAALENAFRTQQLVNFVDMDGAQWTINGGQGALITNLTQDVPVPGPSADGPKERIVSITLIEAVEAY